MKKLCVVLFIISIVAYTAAAEELRPLPRVTIFHYDTADTNVLYDALAAVPMNVFHHQGKVYQSPLVADKLETETTGYLLEDWVNYLYTQGGVKRLDVIGPVPANVEAQYRTMLGLRQTQVRHFNGTPIAVASQIALAEWTQSEYVVLAPFPTQPNDDCLESAAAAAAIAADLNAPLLYINYNAVPSLTQTAITSLHATKAIIVDYGNTLQTGTLSGLSSLGVTLTDNLKTTASVIGYMKARNNRVVLCQSVGKWQLLPAAYGAAVYHGATFFYEAEAAANQADLAMQKVKALPHYGRKTDVSLPADLNLVEDDTWNAFHDWMQSVGAEMPGQLETVLTFAGQDYPSYVLDRAILGDPAYPNDPGCIAGRFPLPDADMNLDLINRTTLYPAITFGNPRRNRVNFAGVCFVAGNNGPGPQYFTNVLGEQHLINEIYGGGYWGDGDEPGVFQSFQDDGGDMMLHNGYLAGHGTDPMFGYDLDGFINEINAGCSFFYYSGHGDANAIGAYDYDGGITQDCDYGSTYWPLEAGIFTMGGGVFSTVQVLHYMQNVHGVCNIYNACDVSDPGSTFNEAWLQKGASCSLGSYCSVGWTNTGYFCTHFIHDFTVGDKPMGEAFGTATGLSSAIFPRGQVSPEPDSLRYVFVGDPNMMYNQPDWTIPAPSALGASYGGHTPGSSGGVNLAYLNAVGLVSVINICWQADEESNCTGYNVYRRQIGQMRWTKINQNLINSGCGSYTYPDLQPASRVQYEYMLGDVSSNGDETVHGPVIGRLSEGFALYHAMPNPVVNSTTLRFSLAQPGNARLVIYDLSGRVVKTLLDDADVTSGPHQVVWDRTDSAGHHVAAGVYVYTLSAGSQNAAKRMVVAR
jgi:hypothetical protein